MRKNHRRGRLPDTLRTVQQVIKTYLAHQAEDLDPRHAAEVLRILGWFGRDLGTKAISRCRAFDLAEWLREHKAWASEWTRRRVSNIVKAPFNWAEKMGLILRNPFRGHCPTRHGRTTRRSMTEPEFRALLRSSGPHFRRFLLALAWTGARPKELRTLRWCDVDLDKELIILQRHKSSRKTRKPRVVPLIPPLAKMLRWIRRRQDLAGQIPSEHCGKHAEAVAALREILAGGPLPTRDTIRQLRERGIQTSYRELWQVREPAGVQVKHVNGRNGKRHTVYELVAPPARQGQEDTRPVFLGEHGAPYTMYRLCSKMKLVRQRLHLPTDCMMYGIRHAWASRAILRGVPMKLAATLLGHEDTEMLNKHYVHVEGMIEPLREAMYKADGASQPPASPEKKGGQP